tara:strand:+ start:170675 stop:171358 length:684 start_codon:yes stop_codon:yes gene_type:complete
VERNGQTSNPNYLGKSFNLLGHIYNPLKRFFLGNLPENVIATAVPSIRKHEHFLIVGAGADNTVLELVKHNKCTQITHVDISSVLSKKGKKRFRKTHPNSTLLVDFIVQPFLSFTSDTKYDAVIFPFYLDVFSEEEVRMNIQHSKKMMNKDGIFYVIDFNSSNDASVKNRVLVKLLYRLFYPFTRVKRNAVPDYTQLFMEAGMVELERRLICDSRYTFHEFTLKQSH